MTPEQATRLRWIVVKAIRDRLRPLVWIFLFRK